MFYWYVVDGHVSFNLVRVHDYTLKIEFLGQFFLGMCLEYRW